MYGKHDDDEWPHCTPGRAGFVWALRLAIDYPHWLPLIAGGWDWFSSWSGMLSLLLGATCSRGYIVTNSNGFALHQLIDGHHCWHLGTEGRPARFSVTTPWPGFPHTLWSCSQLLLAIFGAWSCGRWWLHPTFLHTPERKREPIIVELRDHSIQGPGETAGRCLINAGILPAILPAELMTATWQLSSFPYSSCRSLKATLD